MAIIGKQEIIDRYENENQIIATNFERDHVESAAYELRVSNTELKIDDTPVYEGDEVGNPLNLPARSISVVSSKERLDMPDDLCGRVGIRLEFAKEGLIPMFGPQVDPGYNGRFYGVVYNASGEKVRVCEGDPFFKMELQKVDGCDLSNSVQKTLRNGLDDIDTSATDIRNFRERLDTLEKDTDTHRERVVRVEEGYSQIVLFGVFLLTTTVFGVMLNSLMSTLESVSLGPNLKTGTLLLFLATWWGTLAYFVHRLSNGADDEQEDDEDQQVQDDGEDGDSGRDEADREDELDGADAESDGIPQ